MYNAIEIGQQIIDINNIPKKELSILKKHLAYSKHIPYSNHIRDIGCDWYTVGTIDDWTNIQYQPILNDRGGCYALVFEKEGCSSLNAFDGRTISFGETTRAFHFRLYSHIAAMRGKSTNMSDSYRNHSQQIDEHFKTKNVTSKRYFNRIRIFVRPHDESDKHWWNDRKHSELMETQAQGLYYILNEFSTPGNTRDKPNKQQLNELKAYALSLSSTL